MVVQMRPAAAKSESDVRWFRPPLPFRATADSPVPAAVTLGFLSDERLAGGDAVATTTLTAEYWIG